MTKGREMHCDHLTYDMLLDHLARRIPSPVAEQVDLHLGKCKVCQERYLATARIRETARLALTVAPSRELDERILGGIPESPAPRVVRWKGWIGMAASLAIGISLTFALTHVAKPILPEPVSLRPWPLRDIPLPEIPSPAEFPERQVDLPAVESSPPPPRMEKKETANPPQPLVVVQVLTGARDENGDGQIDVADAAMAIEKEYDMNGDGEFDEADKTIILDMYYH